MNMARGRNRWLRGESLALHSFAVVVLKCPSI